MQVFMQGMVVATKDAMFSDNYLVKIHVKNSLSLTHTRTRTH